jgi:hypothetical protein
LPILARFDADGGGGGGGPPGWPRARSPARLAMIVAILLAFGLGMAIAATYEALEDMQARGEMDPTW